MQLPSEPTTLNLGNIRDNFIQMIRAIMQRNVRLDKYGLAWYNLIREVRNQINQKKQLPLDPAQYPLDSYSIILKPNADKMIPLIGEMDKLYKARLNSNIDLDFSKLLGFADVEVNFESSFYEFEQKKLEELAERSRQEQEQREKEEKMKREKEDESKEEEENLECIKFDSGVKGDFVSLYSRRLLARAARASNNPFIYITSTARDAISQAHAMFNNLERNVALQRRTYRAPGQAVIDVYENMKANKASASEIKSAMIKNK
jgi:hypothetical protein